MVKELGGKAFHPNEINFKNIEGFRLPTQVEWEWFARGGEKAINEGTFENKYFGSDNINEVTCFEENSGRKKNNNGYYRGGSTQDIGLKKPNQLGLYDCSGNVYEWYYDAIDYEKNYLKKGFYIHSIYIWTSKKIKNT